MARPRGGKGRKDHREVVYLSEEVHAKLGGLLQDYPIIESKSRLLEKALEYFIDEVNERGLDWNWRPKKASQAPAMVNADAQGKTQPGKNKASPKKEAFVSEIPPLGSRREPREGKSQ